MITVEDVHRAADIINSGGAKPTYEAIRTMLGSGSFTTIKKALDSWEPNSAEQPGDLGPPPPGLADRAAALAAEIWAMAATVADLLAKEKLADIAARFEKSETNAAELASLADRQQETIDDMTAKLRQRDQDVAAAQALAEKRLNELAAAKAEAKTLRSALSQLTAAVRAGHKSARQKAAAPDPDVTQAA